MANIKEVTGRDMHLGLHDMSLQDGNEPGTVNVYRFSPFSRKVHVMVAKVERAKIRAWASGSAGHIQDVLPELDNEEREFLMTGYTPDDWTKMFGKEEQK